MDERSSGTSSRTASERPEFRRPPATLFLRQQAPHHLQIVDQVYNNPTNLELGKKELSLDSARKSLKRDIDALKATGLIIETAGKTDEGHRLWTVNRDLSFTQGVALSEVDAVFLDIALLPLLNDPGFPERDELRLALAKIDRLFDAAVDALTASSVRDPEVLVTVREALNTRTALDIAYTSRDGSSRHRRVAPLAFFDLRSKLYVVCAPVDNDGNVDAGAAHTYRIDRIESAKRVGSICYEMPDGFDVSAFKKLPFQIGDEAVACTFFIPEELGAALSPTIFGKGSLSPASGGSNWEVEAACVYDAAAWAIANGIRPLAPEGLVSAWRARLEEVLDA